ncbi:ABC transporter permease [Treponema lecithinolyticum]|jgi:spermidine/putrescine ABC transporter, permease protein|uniref:ABC transporter, permease protein n=1 Tax=Treponema lecithinolyticum ATCC 700332 TaxID=1321815 RepID=A0ABN0NXD0_TRELE|nr:ABC transporter permease [Treponema lecithinolyticum]ERJ92078.1 ABC transporter, permease protein [Treponema lecithinolyticum ATCC 700332]
MNPNPFRALINRLNKKRPLDESARHARRAFQKRNPFSMSMTVLVLTLVFLFLPLFVIIAYSFNSGKGGDFTGVSLVWYKKLLFDSKELWQALLNSVIVAFSSAAVATVLGTLAALGVSWHTFKGKSYIQTISFLPMVLPEVIIGVSMLIFFSGIKLPLSLFTVFTAHTTFCLPFVFLMVLARLDEFDYSIIEAAHDLGATERQTMFKVTVPAILPGILSGFLMAVTMSLEDFVITFFVSGPGSTTLPLYVYSMIRFGVSPVINALSFIMILGTVLIAFSLRKFLKNFASAQ